MTEKQPGRGAAADSLSMLMEKYFSGAEIRCEKIVGQLAQLQVAGNVCTLYLVRQGQGQLVVESVPPAYVLHRGDAVIVFGKRGHTIRMGGPDGESLPLTRSIPLELISLTLHFTLPDDKIPGLPDVIHVPRFPKFRTYLDMLSHEEANPGTHRPGGHFCIDCAAGMVATEVIRQYLKSTAVEVQGAQTFGYDRELGGLLSNMREHCEEAWPIERLMGLTALSRTSLVRRFYEKTGMSPKKYLMSCRMHRACRLLCERELGIKEVARRTGYQTIYAFSKAFRVWNGIPPSHYRKQ